MKDELEQAERFQRLFVVPLVEAVRQEVKPLTEGHADLTSRVGKLETNQKRALLGVSAILSVVSVGIGLLMDWVKRKFGLSK